MKCSEKDVFDPEKGLAMAIAKRCGGNKGSYYKEIQNWVEKSGKKYPGKTATQKKAAPKSNPDRESMKKLISKTNEDWNEFLKACANNDNTELLLNMNALTADLKFWKLKSTSKKETDIYVHQAPEKSISTILVLSLPPTSPATRSVTALALTSAVSTW